MSDLISRADAIEAVCGVVIDEFDISPTKGYEVAEKALSALPSADRELANLKEGFESADAEQKSDAYKRGFDDCKRAYEIELARSADAVQGEWTHDGSMWENRWVCDKCGHKIFERQTNFCPNCGAVMKGGAE